MKTKTKFKSIMDRQMEDPEYRRIFDQTWPAFQLEVQFLNALEHKHWTYEHLAKIMGTKKSGISRDLKAGGLQSASMSRIAKMAHALGLKFIPFCVSEKKIKKAMPVIKEFVTV